MDDYYELQDEHPQFIECRDCGENTNVDEMQDGYCEHCNSQEVDRQNKQLAEETLEKALTNALQNNCMPFAIGAMSGMLCRIATEDDLHQLAEIINDYIKEK